MARYLSVAILALLVAGAFAQRTPSPSPKLSPSPSPAAKPAVEASPAPAEADAAPANKLTPAANAAIEDAIARAKPTLRGRDAQRVLDNMKAPLEKVAEAKAAGVPVQIAVARSVTDVQQKVPLNPQSRQAVLDAAYRVYTTAPATLATASPSPSPEPLNVTANATEGMDAMNATMPEDMNMTAGNITDSDMNATMTEEPMEPEANATKGLGATGPAADNATAAAAAPSPSPKPAAKSSSTLSFVSSSLLALLAAAVVALV